MTRLLRALLLAAMLLGGPALAATFTPGAIVRIASSEGGAVNVRSAPEIAGGNVVGQVASGTLAQVAAQERRGVHTWYRVQVAPAGMQGWVRGDLLQAARESGADDAPAAADGGSGAPAGAGTGTDLVAIPTLPMPTPENDWTRNVSALLPAVDSCLAVVTVGPATVTRVYQLEREMAGVRMQDRSGRRWECLVQRRGGTPFRYEPLADRVRPLPGDGNPIFTRAPALPPNDPCWRNMELRDQQTDVLLGTRSYKTC